MAIVIAEARHKVLETLANAPRDASWSGKLFTGSELADATGLTVDEINDAVTTLVEDGLAEWHRLLATSPFVFGRVYITSRGRFELESGASSQDDGKRGRIIPRPLTPVGSPYGFLDDDWEILISRRSSVDTLYVVLGFQFGSDRYGSHQLVSNVKRSFKQALGIYHENPRAIRCSLDFRPLAAGYGEHLFNEIARDIIASDIAVFDTSDLNPNVMLEMGVALTWGVHVLPIKRDGDPRPPSDISGQTWADYEDSAARFLDPDHTSKLAGVIDRAIRKKALGVAS